MTITLDTTSLYSGQGFNVQNMVNQILDSRRGQETQWKNQQTTLQNQTTALNSLESQIATLYTDTNDLCDFSGVMASKTASSSNTGIVVATATSAAATANHILQVQSLAANGAAYSNSVASDAILDKGSLTITTGSNSKQVDVGTTNTSLADVADAINKLSMGVNATVQTDSTGSRLTIVSITAGKAGSVTVTGGTDQLSFTNLAGTDAVVNIDGVPYESDSNTVSGAIPGVTLNLASAAPDTDVTLSVSPDATSVAQAVSSFVSDYNAIVSAINTQFSYDATTKTSGALSGDSSVSLVQDTLLQAISFGMTGNGSINTLADLGVTMNDDGTLSVNSTTLNRALTSNFSDLENFFQGTGSFGAALQKTMGSLNDPTNGPLDLDLNAINQTNQDLTNQINDFEARLSTQEQQLLTQYSQINAELQELPSLQDQVSQMLGVLNPTSNSSTTKSSSSS